MNPSILDADLKSELRFDAQGLLPAIAQDWQTGEVLMVAWMNEESLALSLELGRAVYWSRSRQRLWRKGEESGHVQKLHEVRLDCDGDVILLRVEQVGGIACHTGRAHCFFRRAVQNQGVWTWKAVDPVLKDPALIYPAS